MKTNQAMAATAKTSVDMCVSWRGQNALRGRRSGGCGENVKVALLFHWPNPAPHNGQTQNTYQKPRVQTGRPSRNALKLHKDPQSEEYYDAIIDIKSYGIILDILPKSISQ